MPGPYVLERAVDAAPRHAFRARGGVEKWQSFILIRPVPGSRRARFRVAKYMQNRRARVLADGDTHRDFPGFVAQGGCLQAPPGVCGCGLKHPRPYPGDDVMPLDDDRESRGLTDDRLHELND